MDIYLRNDDYSPPLYQLSYRRIDNKCALLHLLITRVDNKICFEGQIVAVILLLCILYITFVVPFGTWRT